MPQTAQPVRPRPSSSLTYSDQRNSSASQRRHVPTPARRGPPAGVAGEWTRKGPAVTDESAGGSAPGPDSAATTKIPLQPPADDFRPDVPADDFQPDVPEPAGDRRVFRRDRRVSDRDHRRRRPRRPTARPRCRCRADRRPTTAATPPVSRSLLPRRENPRSNRRLPTTTSTSFPAPPSQGVATGC